MLFLLGFAEQFMAADAGAFVGTLWAVRSDTALRFAECFYQTLAEGRSLGEASHDARLLCQRQRSDPSWLAYSVYGDPKAKATP
jgi:CHAT domain-containing protein